MNRHEVVAAELVVVAVVLDEDARALNVVREGGVVQRNAAQLVHQVDVDLARVLDQHVEHVGLHQVGAQVDGAVEVLVAQTVIGALVHQELQRVLALEYDGDVERRVAVNVRHVDHLCQ